MSDQELYAEVELRVNRARKSLIAVGDRPGLIDCNGVYDVAPGSWHCTVLESLVLQEPYTGDIVHDASVALGVSRDWIEGFLVGHATRYSHREIRRIADGIDSQPQN